MGVNVLECDFRYIVGHFFLRSGHIQETVFLILCAKSPRMMRKKNRESFPVPLSQKNEGLIKN